MRSYPEETHGAAAAQETCDARIKGNKVEEKDERRSGPKKLGHGHEEGGRLRIAVTFEKGTFQRIRDQAEERGASISEHVDWLVRRCWRLEEHLERIKATEARVAARLRERERNSRIK